MKFMNEISAMDAGKCVQQPKQQSARTGPPLSAERSARLMGPHGLQPGTAQPPHGVHPLGFCGPRSGISAPGISRPALTIALIACLALTSLFARAAESPQAGAIHSAPTVRAPYRPNAKASIVPLGPTAGASAPQQTIVLPPFSSELLEQLRQEDSTPMHQRLRIGLSRAFDKPVVVNNQTVPSSAWRALPNGWRTYSVQFIAQGAMGMRVHVESATLPSGARLVVYDPQQPEQAHSPITQEDFGQESEVWTEPILAENSVLECELPPDADPASVAFTVGELTHHYRSAPAYAQPRGESCEKDATCYPQWAQQEAAVARIDFIDAGSEYLCSGCLLNHLNTNVVADYFLTANHCINNQKAAATIFFYWLYQTTVCNDPNTAPNLSCTNTPFTIGANLLAHSANNDFSFLQLQQAPPAGVYYAGWTTELPSTNEMVTVLHHPGQPPFNCGDTPTDYTRISFGNLVGTANLGAVAGTGSGTQNNIWEVQWYSGITEDGSSGSPLFDTNQMVIGQLYGGTSDCTNQSGEDIFGRFDITYPNIEKWLGQAAFLDGTTNGSSYSGLSPGTYEGLFYDTNGVAPVSSGSITLKISPKSTYTGKLLNGATRYSLTGVINAAGTSSTTAKGPKGNTLSVFLSFGTTSNQLMGTVSNALWSAELSANQAIYNSRTNPAQFQTRYTMIIPGSTNGGPQGDGYCAIQIKSSGQLSLSGSLADGTTLTESSTVLENGLWPMYVPLYHAQGVILGWLTFDTNQPVSGLTGSLSWIKPSSSAKVYPGGFTNQVIEVMGSSYDRTIMPLITLSNGVIILSGGALSTPFTNTVMNGQNNKLVSSNGTTLSITAASGLFSGAARITGQTQRVPFRGALLQSQNAGYGYFLLNDQSGSVFLGTE